MEYKDATIEEIELTIQQAWAAFEIYRNFSLQQRAAFMRAIAAELDKAGDALLEAAAAETHLPVVRLRNERARTMFQLTSYADACEAGNWLEARIDTAVPGKNPPKPDLRKMLVPLGPVVVFGAANFPFAYSTAGGDTACALAAGCPVIVKAHPGHAHTSQLVADAIVRAARATGVPDGVFAHLHGASFEVGKALIEHPLIKAAGFTGSFAGGKQLFDWANQRKEPIPVFAEMSSVNPVYLLPDKLKEAAEETARLYAGSITLGVGQFCTNPGILIAVEGEALDRFTTVLTEEIKKTAPGDMLNIGIFKNYVEKRANALAQEGVEMSAVPEADPQLEQGLPTLATTTAAVFLENPLLQKEVFGPYSLLVVCRTETEMLEIARHMEGQLTSTLMATNEDLERNKYLVDVVKNHCGRLILNGVPTGVEVCLSMHHGGPFPSTTDSRFTSVGADGIKRFARPVAFQNWTDEWLPAELKNNNPLGIWRTVNNELTKKPVAVGE
jgi:alpha-ketoglutaric semialdehyde dehydrogenase